MGPKQRKTLQVLGIHAILITLSLLFLLPALWMLVTSLKIPEEVIGKEMVWLPTVVRWQNYPDAFAYNAENLGYVPFLVYGRNTLILCSLVVSGTLISNSLVAYAFAKLRWRGRDTLFALTLATMMVPFPVIMVPQFAMMREFEWIGTYRPLWVPAFFGSAFNIFLLRQFFSSIPKELSEATRIDGGSEWLIFTRVVLPLSKPALITVGLFSFMGVWGDFLGPLVYLLDQRTFTLAQGLQAYQSQAGGTSWNLLMAASLMVIAPVIVLYFFAQRFFIQGITLTGIKG